MKVSTPRRKFRYLIECATAFEKHVWYYDTEHELNTMPLAEQVCQQLRTQFSDLHLNHVTRQEIDANEPAPVSTEGVRVWSQQSLPVAVTPRLLGGSTR